MALSKSAKDCFGDELACGICKGKLKDGQFLKCFHSFCKQCLREKYNKDPESYSGLGMSAISVAQGMFRVAAHMLTATDPKSDGHDINKIECPVCHRDGPAKLQDFRQYIFPNIFADMKLESLELTDNLRRRTESPEAISCESCQENDAKVDSYCVDCIQFICEPCVAAHKKLSVTRSHSLISVNDLKNGKTLVDVKRESATPHCSRHPSSSISMLCTICQTAICSQCSASDEHRLHSCVEISDGLKPFLVEAQTLLAKIGPAKFDEIVAGHLQHKKEIAEKAEELRKQINEDAQAASADLLKQIEDKRLTMMAKVTRIESHSTQATNELIQSLEELRTRANKAESYVDILSRHGTNTDVLAARQGGILDLLRDMGSEVASKGSSRTKATLKLHTTSFPFPRFQLKWYTPIYAD